MSLGNASLVVMRLLRDDTNYAKLPKRLALSFFLKIFAIVVYAAAKRFRLFAEAMSMPESSIDNLTWSISSETPSYAHGQISNVPASSRLYIRQPVTIPTLDAVTSSIERTGRYRRQQLHVKVLGNDSLRGR